MERRHHIDKALLTCTGVFIRCDAIRNPRPATSLLQQLPGGQAKVTIYFTVDIGGCKDTVSIDWNRANLDSTDDNPPISSFPSQVRPTASLGDHTSSAKHSMSAQS